MIWHHLPGILGVARFLRTTQWTRASYVLAYGTGFSLSRDRVRECNFLPTPFGCRERDNTDLPRQIGMLRQPVFVVVLCGQVFKSKRWMPWHLEPKKDVEICDKPRGADNRAVIRGCPNGETPPGRVRTW